ncbi:MAG: hypothetical protein ACERJ2_10055, partial [Filomicrobium sp.]
LIAWSTRKCLQCRQKDACLVVERLFRNRTRLVPITFAKAARVDLNDYDIVWLGCWLKELLNNPSKTGTAHTCVEVDCGKSWL